ncbi:MAG: patatin-like phospholipase family protein, partial [Burkholderiales bacterium]
MKECIGGAGMGGAAATGLVLTGGGARAAYQVGVLQALRLILDTEGVSPQRSPFGVVCGTSAGAINATALACRADHFDEALDKLSQVWENFSAEQVYQSDVLSVLRTGTRWLTMLTAGWAFRRSRKLKPRSLFDNTPLVNLLHNMIDLPRLERALVSGDLHALAITASDYSSGRHVTFYQTPQVVKPWVRSQRVAVPHQITIEHLVASSAIPFIFPATPLYLEGKLAYFGDGSMRQLAPISPAIHLGAERVLVIGAGQINAENRFVGPPSDSGNGINTYPTLAQIAGHAMSSIFLDSLAMDIERLERVNKTISLIPPEVRRNSSLREIDVLV